MDGVGFSGDSGGGLFPEPHVAAAAGQIVVLSRCAGGEHEQVGKGSVRSDLVRLAQRLDAEIWRISTSIDVGAVSSEEEWAAARVGLGARRLDFINATRKVALGRDDPLDRFVARPSWEELSALLGKTEGCDTWDGDGNQTKTSSSPPKSTGGGADPRQESPDDGDVIGHGSACSACQRSGQEVAKPGAGS
ncbi:hypothetical protein GCM10020219_078070 [Nonomuraea dietziae]